MDVIRIVDLLCIVGILENLNYFDMCLSFKWFNKMYILCKSEFLFIDLNMCIRVVDSEKISLYCNVFFYISNSIFNIVFFLLFLCVSYGIFISFIV